MIEVEGLTRYYGSFPAVSDLSFSISEREIVGLLGLNGAGKTTTLRVLAGLMMPSAGTVRIAGIDAVAAPHAIRRRIGFLPENPPLYPEMRVVEFLRWCGQIKGMAAAEVQRRLPDVLETCQLTDARKKVIGELSHGYRKRVGIAQAIVHRPALVILDEPISGLDPQQIVGMREVVRSLGRESTVLISSHILSEITHTCDRILVIDRGRLIAQGTENELGRRLGGGQRIDIEVRGERALLAPVLARIPAVTSHEILDDSDGVLRISVVLTEDRREELVAALVRDGMGIRKIQPSDSELEQIFLELTQAAPTRRAEEVTA